MLVRKSLEEEWSRYQKLFETAPDGMFITDLKGIIRVANHDAEDLLGLPQQKLTGKSLGSFMEESNRSEFRRQLQALTQIDELREFDCRLHTARGLPIDVSLSASIFRSPDGAAPGVRWLLRDITQQKISQRILEDSEARFRTIFEQAGLGIELISLKGRIIESNSALQEMLG
ncbi:MAG: PAS domain S-box protein [Chloroflexi bacterium]|nr:PAS domain S-box protein [Chloroflexota bacterium]